MGLPPAARSSQGFNGSLYYLQPVSFVCVSSFSSFWSFTSHILSVLHLGKAGLGFPIGECFHPDHPISL